MVQVSTLTSSDEAGLSGLCTELWWVLVHVHSRTSVCVSLLLHVTDWIHCLLLSTFPAATVKYSKMQHVYLVWGVTAKICSVFLNCIFIGVTKNIQFRIKTKPINTWMNKTWKITKVQVTNDVLDILKIIIQRQHSKKKLFFWRSRVTRLFSRYSSFIQQRAEVNGSL